MATQEDLKQKLEQKDKPKTFSGMLQVFAPEIQRALPAHMKGNIDRYTRLALTQFKQNPKLAECDPRSVFGAIIMATQLGLELGVMGQAWLVPYRNRGFMECQLIPGWLGYMDLLHRHGKAHAYTGVIYKDQQYEFRDGSVRSLSVLNETNLDDPADITHAYAIGYIKGVDQPVMDLWRVEKCHKHRDRYNKVGQRHYSYENWEMYCRKVVLLQVLKYLPRSVEIATATQLDAAADLGAPGPSIEEALEGTFQVLDTGEMTEEERQAALAREKAEADGKS